MHHILSIVKLVLTLGIVACAAYLYNATFGSVGGVVGTSVERADELRRSVLGWEQKPLKGSEGEVAVAAIAAGVAIDSEGEPPQTLVRVQEAMIDAHLRYKQLHPEFSYQEIVEKSRLWLPDDWAYPWWWRDRPVTMLMRGRETTIKRLTPLIEAKLSATRIAEGCADRYVRPGWHTGGILGGERFRVFVEPAASRVKRMTPDLVLHGKGFKTGFFCSQP